MVRLVERKVQGAVVVVTGSARGIGAATAQAFIAAGATVVIADIDADALAAAKDSLRPALALPLDVTSRESFEKLFEAVTAELGPVDVLVNNAGIMPVAPVTEIGDALARRVNDINFLGMTTGTRVALSHMVPRRRGHIINVSSMLGVIVGPAFADYCASKAAIIAWTDAARLDMRRSGVKFTLVLPGQADTELTSGLTPVRGFRLATPESIAEAIVAAARRPRRRVYTPRTFAALAVMYKFLPQGVSDPLLRLFGSERVLAGQDRGARSAYNNRVNRLTEELTS
jgi:NAD(P)-dependent dehydrogenase (short-subunit alcohol dehydrogenase family)